MTTLMPGWDPEPPLTCRQVTRILQAYLDAMIDKRTARQAAEHLESCRRCGLEARTYRAIKNALARHERPAATAVAHLRAFGRALPGTAPDKLDSARRKMSPC